MNYATLVRGGGVSPNRCRALDPKRETKYLMTCSRELTQRHRRLSTVFRADSLDASRGFTTTTLKPLIILDPDEETSEVTGRLADPCEGLMNAGLARQQRYDACKVS